MARSRTGRASSSFASRSSSRSSSRASTYSRVSARFNKTPSSRRNTSTPSRSSSSSSRSTPLKASPSTRTPVSDSYFGSKLGLNTPTLKKPAPKSESLSDHYTKHRLSERTGAIGLRTGIAKNRPSIRTPQYDTTPMTEHVWNRETMSFEKSQTHGLLRDGIGWSYNHKSLLPSLKFQAYDENRQIRREVESRAGGFAYALGLEAEASRTIAKIVTTIGLFSSFMGFATGIGGVMSLWSLSRTYALAGVVSSLSHLHSFINAALDLQALGKTKPQHRPRGREFRDTTKRHHRALLGLEELAKENQGKASASDELRALLMEGGIYDFLAGGMLYNACLAGGFLYNPTQLIDPRAKAFGVAQEVDTKLMNDLLHPYENLAGGRDYAKLQNSF